MDLFEEWLLAAIEFADEYSMEEVLEKYRDLCKA